MNRKSSQKQLDRSSEESLDSNLNNKSSEEAFQQNWPSSPKKSVAYKEEELKEENQTHVDRFNKTYMEKSKSNLFDNG